jgi:hypothetical protein
MKIRTHKIWIVSIIALILISILNVNVVLADSTKQMDTNNLSFKQEIQIPFDTALLEAKFQPIDLKIVFENKCWAIDENQNSVRIAFDDGSSLTEIESQIYDLKNTDESHISECNIVFLIPEEANGKEKYYVMYDSKEIENPDYEDHVRVEDTHYFYEPISGQKIDCDYYGIWDDESVIYGVTQVGELLGNPISQGILKFKPGSKKVETYNIDQLGVFDMRHGTFAQPGYIGSAWAKNVKKEVIVDGNLMARVRIEGVSPSGDIKTDNIFTYYHSPIEKRRIYVNAYHEVLNDITVEEPSILDGTYCGIVTIKSRSATIEKMNVGEILPKMYVYSLEDEIDNFDVPQNPSTIEREILLSTQDDIDLGKNSWVCLSDDSTGKSHGIILDKNVGFAESDDGVQVKSWVKENIKLPGLEADTGNLYLARDSYDINGNHDKNLKKGFNVNYNAVFITLEEGYEEIDKESEIYQKLVKIFPIFRESEIEEQEDVERYSLECYVHMASSIPLGSLLSAATGKKIPYIYAELYKENSFKSSGSVGRLALGSVDINLEGKTLLEKIKTIFGIFDIKNSSFFKKIKFPDLEAGKYLVKIFRENPFLGEERKYIGYSIVEVNQDSKTRIFCKPEAKSSFFVKDQSKKAIPGFEFQFLQDDVIVSDGFTDENGSVILKAPIQPKEPYTLRILYKGFLLEEQDVKLGILNRFREYSDIFSFDLYDLSVKIVDKWGLIPAVDLNPKITSNEMFKITSISSDKYNEGVYFFENIIPASYFVDFRYKSFEVSEKIDFKSNKNVEVLLDAEYEIDLNLKNSYGMDLAEKGDLIISRSGKTVSFDIDENDPTIFKLPPGDYKIDFNVDDETIASQNLDVRGEKTLDIITKKGSFLHTALSYLGILIILFSIGLIIWKRKYNMGIKLLLIGVLIFSLVSPWWVLNGEDGEITTQTNTLLIPPKLVSLTESSNVIGGQISQVPEEVTLVLNLLFLLILVCCVMLFISIFTENKFKKITKILSIFTFLILIVSVFVFFYAMSQLTMIGVGSFMGSGDVDITIPGTVEAKSISSSWGPGTGFLLSFFAIIIILGFFFLKKRFSDKISD